MLYKYNESNDSQCLFQNSHPDGVMKKKLFTSFLQEEIPEYPISNEYWKNCAHAMNADLGSNRTGEA